MLGSIRKFTALILLLVIPLQGISASSLASLQCPPSEAGAEYSADGAPNFGQERDDGTAGKPHDHLVCHQTVSAPPVTTTAGLIPELPILASFSLVLSSLFLPEQPQRPPFPR